MSEDRAFARREYRGSKIFQYPDPLPLETIRDRLQEHGCIIRREPDRDSAGEKKTIESELTILDLIDGVGLFGKIIYKKQEMEIPSGDHFMKRIPFDFFISRDPSVLIIHGKHSLVDKIKEGLERAIYYNNDPFEPRKNSNGEEPDPFFSEFSNHDSFDKYVVKKIVKRIEAEHERNILYDPHFQQLRDNVSVRGGECFWRRDGTSATQDERFCYLFDLCTYWVPDMYIHTCVGIVSPTALSPIKMTINADFSFRFSHNIRKEVLDAFWIRLILPILLENNYEEERTECDEPARNYAERITPSQ